MTRGRASWLFASNNARFLRKVSERRQAELIFCFEHLAARFRLERHDERVLDAEDDVAVEIGVALDEEMRRERLVSFRRDDEVEMRRTHRVAAHRVQDRAHRSIGRYRIARRLDGAEEEISLAIALEASAQIEAILI